MEQGERVDFGVAPWVIVTAVVAWFGNSLKHRLELKKVEFSHEESIDKHKDDLTFQLITSAHNDVKAARSEVEGLREEIKSLRSLEQHFYHFQQAIEHLEAITYAPGMAERKVAERNAKAFLVRMRRLTEAKGTIANEVQHADSTVTQAEKTIHGGGTR